MTPLSKRHKVVLLRGAAARGPRPALRQLGTILMDSFLREDHRVFRLESGALAGRMPDVPGAAFREVRGWEDIPEAGRRLLADPAEAIFWGDPAWFERGWRLWICELDGRLAAVNWIRPHAAPPDFFCEMTPGAELIWQGATLPGFQGRKLHVAIMVAAMLGRAAAGAPAFYSSVRAYNTPSLRNMAAAGFTPIGRCTVSRLTGRRVWEPRR